MYSVYSFSTEVKLRERNSCAVVLNKQTVRQLTSFSPELELAELTGAAGSHRLPHWSCSCINTGNKQRLRSDIHLGLRGKLSQYFSWMLFECAIKSKLWFWSNSVKLTAASLNAANRRSSSWCHSMSTTYRRWPLSNSWTCLPEIWRYFIWIFKTWINL